MSVGALGTSLGIPASLLSDVPGPAARDALHLDRWPFGAWTLAAGASAKLSV